MPPADRLNLTVERASAPLMLGEEAGWNVAAQIPADVPSLQERQHVTKAHLDIGNMAMAIWGRYEEARTGWRRRWSWPRLIGIGCTGT